jgi:hypothetical protein
MTPKYQTRGRMITAASLIVVGLIWIGQGLGVFRGSSFMVDDLRWSFAGLAAVVLGLLLALRAWRHSRRGA